MSKISVQEGMVVGDSKIARLLLILSVTVAFGTAPAHAARIRRVPISLTIEGDKHPGGPLLHDVRSCTLLVPTRSDGFVLFREAVRSRCIVSFSTWKAPWGTWIACIDSDCEGAIGIAIYVVRYWEVHENDAISKRYDDRGLGALRNDRGDRYLFSLKTVCCYS